MLPYVGNGEYCFSNSLHMSLLGSGAPPESLPSPSFLECLTTIPFGNTYLKEAELFFFCGPNPDFGRTRVIEIMGWTCQVEYGGTEEVALARLRAAAQHAPVLIGPLNMGYLTYNPTAPSLDGVDHFIVVLSVEEDRVVVHDPKGFPCTILPFEDLLKAWRAERIAYRTEPYTQRSAFRPVQPASRQQMIERIVPDIGAKLRQERWESGMYGGVAALRMLAHTLRAQVPTHLANHLLYYALPLAVRHKVDAQAFLREGHLSEAADLLEQQARLLGQAQYAGVQHTWSSVATLIEQVATIEERLISVSRSW